MPSLWEKLSDLRYQAVVEQYASVGTQLTMGRERSGMGGLAVAARAAEHAAEMPSSPEQPSTPAPSLGVQALQAVASGIDTLVGIEQKASALLSGIPTPASAALRVFDLDLGLPHAHAHPPNLTPPNPVPLPLPSLGPVLKIPTLSGAGATLINKSAAARCGDVGLASWCGGYLPMFEVFLGSSSVWIEGARAARRTVDITKHCSFTVPKPTDPPIGPMVGITFMGSPNVLIGGVPMPSLFGLAIAQAFKFAFKAGTTVFRGLTAKAYVQKLLRDRTVRFATGMSAQFQADVVADLQKMALRPTGRNILKRIERSGRFVEIEDYRGYGLNSEGGGMTYDGVMDFGTGRRAPGTDGTVAHTPSMWANHAPDPAKHRRPGTPSDAILAHEMNHAANATEGRMIHEKKPGQTAAVTTRKGDWHNRWTDYEEYNTTHTDNAYRRESGLPRRVNYYHMP